MIGAETQKKVTLEEFAQLSDVCVELIHGRIVRKPTPNYEHQKTVGSILGELVLELRKNHKGEAILSPIDVFIAGHVLQPDLLFIATERLGIIGEEKIKGSPDVIFEVTEYATNFNDTKVKFDIYEQFGVKEYFIVYPDDKTVVKYVLTDGKFHEQYREIGFVKSEAMNCEVNF